MRAMHKLFVFSLIVVLFGLNGQTATARVPTFDEEAIQTTKDARDEIILAIDEKLKASIGELGLVNTMNQAQDGEERNAANVSARENVRIGGHHAAVSKRSGIEEQYCWHGSNTRGKTAIADFVSKKADEIFKRNSDILNGAPGTIGEHGGANAKVVTFDTAVAQHCDSDAMGGDLKTCAGAGLAYLTDATDIIDPVIDPAEMQRVDAKMAVQLASLAIAADSNPDRYINANANTKMEVVDEKAMTSLVSAALAIKAKNLALRAKMPGPISSIKTLRETMLANGAMSQEVVDKYLPESGTSYMGYMKGFIEAQMHSDRMMQSLLSNPDTLAIVIASNSMMQTAMMHEIFEAAMDERALLAETLLIDVNEKLKKPLDDRKAAANAGVMASR